MGVNLRTAQRYLRVLEEAGLVRYMCGEGRRRGGGFQLWGVDAVEFSQTCLDRQGRPWLCGRRVAFALADLLDQCTVTCVRKDADRYGRMVTVCCVGGAVYPEVQSIAQREGRGIWQGPFQPSWEYPRDPRNLPTAGTTEDRCNPAHPGVCVPPPPPDLDYGNTPHKGFRVLPRISMGLFGRDRNEVGCEGR